MFLENNADDTQGEKTQTIIGFREIMDSLKTNVPEK